MTDYSEHRNDPPNNAGQEFGGDGSDTGWAVEARLAYPTPEVIGGHALDDRWRRIYFPKGYHGVPIGRPGREGVLELCGLMDYAAAQALRWWFVAEAAAGMKHLCLETRLILHSIKWSYHYTAESAHDLIDGKSRNRARPAADAARAAE